MRTVRGRLRWSVQAVAGATALLAIGLTAACGSSGEGDASRASRLVEPGSGYVALGSSFAAGPAISPLRDEACGRSGANYASLLSATLDLRLVDVTCSGATIANVLDTPQPTGDVEQAPQIRALRADTRLVTLTVGGNDVGYADLLDALGCVDSGACPSDATDHEAAGSTVDAMGERLTALIQAVQTTAPAAEVLLVTYPRIVPPGGATCAKLTLSPEHARLADAIGAQLNQKFRDVALRTGVPIVDVYMDSGSHTACSDDPWVTGWVGDDEAAGLVSYHPTAIGMRHTADAVVAALGHACGVTPWCIGGDRDAGSGVR